MDREQPRAEARGPDPPGDQQRRRRGGEREQVEGRRRRRAELRHRHRAERDALPAVERRVDDDGADHEGDGEREQREQLAAHAPDPEDDRAERHPQQRGGERGGGECPQERHVVAAGEQGGRVDPGAVECAVAEREVTGIPRKDVPRRGEHDPVEDEVEERLVERRRMEEGHRRERESGADDRGESPVRFQDRSGRRRSSAISSVNETIGAHDGEANAIVTASLTPITTPAASGPSAEPSPPSITAANTTPTHA